MANSKDRDFSKNIPVQWEPLPNMQYDILYMDPPWAYEQCLSSQVGIDEFGKPVLSYSAAQYQYPTLSIEELKTLDVPSICKPDCLLFMWMTGPLIQPAIELGNHWGFSFKTFAYVWNKIHPCMGNYTMSQCEYVGVFKKGKIPQPRGARNEMQYIEKNRGEHSSKPIEVLRSIERMFPDPLSRIELFARVKVKSWDAWGHGVQGKEKDFGLF